MVELVPGTPSVVACLADAPAVDAAVAAWPGTAIRIAPDEAMLVTIEGAGAAGDVGGRAAAGDVARAAVGADADVLVVDVSDGWALWRLDGDEAAAAFARISDVPVPDGVAQGEVAAVPAKVVGGNGSIVVLVEAMWRDAVRERILADCADLGVREARAGRGTAVAEHRR